jgi:hypothetical protein
MRWRSNQVASHLDDKKPHEWLDKRIMIADLLLLL